MEVMAREGVCFNSCISNYPLCSPFRASLLTGQYATVHGVVRNVNDAGNTHIPLETETIAVRLKKHGYATGYVGKWHLYHSKTAGQGNDERPYLVPEEQRHGFDYWRACYNYRKRHDTRYLDEAGREHVLPEYAPKSQMDLAFEFIEQNKGRPFCVFVSWHPPHAPFGEAPERFKALYRKRKMKQRPNAKALSGHAVGYFSHISALDDEIGRTIEKLESLGIDDNTIVVYTSDHGEMLGSHGNMGKNHPWEESINVPFFIRWPDGIPGNRVTDEILSTVDIAPTLLGLAGVPIPESMQGNDLSDFLRGKEVSCPKSALIMSFRWHGVRTTQHTYVKRGGVEGRKGTPWYLYDNRKDTYQLNNLIGKEECKDIQSALEQELQELLDMACATTE
jgi:arylsulfatase A-like enzyme